VGGWPGIEAASAEDLIDRFGVPGNHCKQDARGCVGNSSALLPIAQRGWGEPESGRELSLAQTHPRANLFNVNDRDLYLRSADSLILSFIPRDRFAETAENAL